MASPIQELNGGVVLAGEVGCQEPRSARLRGPGECVPLSDRQVEKHTPLRRQVPQRPDDLLLFMEPRFPHSVSRRAYLPDPPTHLEKNLEPTVKWHPAERVHVPVPKSEELGLLLHPRDQAWQGERAHIPEPLAKLGEALIPKHPASVRLALGRKARVQGPQGGTPREEEASVRMALGRKASKQEPRSPPREEDASMRMALGRKAYVQGPQGGTPVWGEEPVWIRRRRLEPRGQLVLAE